MLSKYNWNLKIGLKKQMGWLLQLSFVKRSQAVSGKSFTVTEIKHRSLTSKLWTYFHFHVHELTKKN